MPPRLPHRSAFTLPLRPHILNLPRTQAPAHLRRPFSSTPRPQTKTVLLRRLPQELIPPYPYPLRQSYKQSNHGLYGAKPHIQVGNVRTGSGGATIKSRGVIKVKRTWRLNVQQKRFWSPALRCWIKTRMTTRVFRTIMKAGTIDNYVLGDKEARIKELGPGGWKLRWLVMQSDKIREDMRAEREALGVKPTEAAEGEEALYPETPCKEGMYTVAMDYATPGKVSLRSRVLMQEYLEKITGMEEFGIGSEESLTELRAVRDWSARGANCRC